MKKSRGLIRVSVPGYVMVNIQFDDSDKPELSIKSILCIQNIFLIFAGIRI